MPTDRSGYNSHGNHYSTAGGSNRDTGNSYHYSNRDGSYYYRNDNGSTYHMDRSGNAVYTPPSSSNGSGGYAGASKGAR
eukprot:CAMPEP_0204606744 /NCGR_PEP_ID=MMETSP0661-20131031/59278_1 /ASSEMBLY_ACC=CAM_ASM_000606 /TAXON_ID=109239 /ORGANISM="Alexandrium margalefi, Strain AMGDE01CS-322" /LENGTH=78 /DNA_ID=CAMNT_0051618097 /DNA_START=99 /DNA_END=335 /DNA_ORIENTATION=+